VQQANRRSLIMCPIWSQNDPGCVKTLIDRRQMGIVSSGLNELEVVVANACYAIRHRRKIVLYAARVPAFLHGQDPNQKFIALTANRESRQLIRVNFGRTVGQIPRAADDLWPPASVA
jgi:hypothetical protein